MQSGGSGVFPEVPGSVAIDVLKLSAVRRFQDFPGGSGLCSISNCDADSKFK
jgi:hypothetical protein